MDSLRNDDNDGIPTFTIGDEVKIVNGKYSGAYGVLSDVSPQGLCEITRGAVTYFDVAISDLAVN